MLIISTIILGALMIVPGINPPGNFNYPFSQTLIPRGKTVDLPGLICRLDEAKTLIADSSAATPAGEVKSQETTDGPKTKETLSPDAVYSAQGIFSFKFLSPDGRFFLYRDHTDPNETEKLFDAENQKDINITGGGFLGGLPDEAVLIFRSDAKNYEIHRVAFDINGTKKETPLTKINRGKENSFNYAYIKEHDKLYLYVPKTEETKRIFCVDLKQKEVNLDTLKPIYEADAETRFIKDIEFSPNGEFIVFTKVHKKDPGKEDKSDEICLYDIKKQEPLVIEGKIKQIKFSLDGQYVAYRKIPPGGDGSGEIFIYDITNTQERQITRNDNKHVEENLTGWSPDSKYLIYKQKVQIDNGIFPGNSPWGLWSFDVTGESKIPKLLIDEQKIDVQGVQISGNKDKNYLFFSAPNRFYNDIYKLDLNYANSDDYKPRDLKPILSKDESEAKNSFISWWQVSDDASKIFYTTQAPGAIGTLRCLDLSSGERKIIKKPNKAFYDKYEFPKSDIKSFTYSYSKDKDGKTKKDEYGNPEYQIKYPAEESSWASYTGEDGKNIPIEYKITYPPGYNKEENKKYPLLVIIHGGPNGRFGAGFDSDTNVYASQGYVVVTPNIRGSEGYNLGYYRSIMPENNKNVKLANIQRGYEDIMATLEHVIKNSGARIDTAKICLNGFSYGGSLVNYIACVPNKYEFAALVAEEGEPQYALEAFKETIKNNPGFEMRPLCIIQNTNDEIIPFNGVEDFYKELKNRKKNAELIIYDHHYRGGHCFEHTRQWRTTNWNNVADFFNRHCPPDKKYPDSIPLNNGRGTKEINITRASSFGGVGPFKEAGSGRKFAIIKFTPDFEGIMKISSKSPVLTDENGNKYPAALASTRKADDTPGNWIKLTEENDDNTIDEGKTMFLQAPQIIELAFDVPKDAEKFTLEIDGFPSMEVKLNPWKLSTI